MSNENLPANAPEKLLNELIKTCERYVWFPESHQSFLVALWIIATYFHTHFGHTGILWITAPTIRAGKTTLLNLIGALSYNCSGRWCFPTPSSLFRGSYRRTVVIDEYEKLAHGTKKLLDGVLLAGFEAGAKTARSKKVTTYDKATKKKTEDWESELVEVYGPKVIGSCDSHPEALTDRCFIIQLKRKDTGEQRELLNMSRPPAAFSALKTRLVELMIPVYVDRIAAAYTNSDKLDIPALRSSDRLKNIATPLLAIAQVIDKDISSSGREPWVLKGLSNSLNSQAEIIKENEEPDDTPLIVQAMDNMLGTEKEIRVTPGEISQRTPGNPQPRVLGRCLNELRLKRVAIHGSRKVVLERTKIDELKARYGLDGSADSMD